MARTPLVVALVVALAGALAYYMVRDFTRRERPAHSVTPCGSDDRDREVVATLEGKFCIEKNTEDLIKSTLKGQRLWEPEIVDQFKKYVHAGDLVVDAGPRAKAMRGRPRSARAATSSSCARWIRTSSTRSRS